MARGGGQQPTEAERLDNIWTRSSTHAPVCMHNMVNIIAVRVAWHAGHLAQIARAGTGPCTRHGQQQAAASSRRHGCLGEGGYAHPLAADPGPRPQRHLLLQQRRPGSHAGRLRHLQGPHPPWLAPHTMHIYHKLAHMAGKQKTTLNHYARPCKARDDRACNAQAPTPMIFRPARAPTMKHAVIRYTVIYAMYSKALATQNGHSMNTSARAPQRSCKIP